MSYSCKILLDSISPTGKRLTTMEVTFPRCVLAEAETHRVFSGYDSEIETYIVRNLGINVDKNLSRNSASSRAIPINKILDRVTHYPFIPEKFGKPERGMGAKEYWPVDSHEHKQLENAWNAARLATISIVGANLEIGNKEDLNRLLEPFMWHTAILTATEWDNFFKLRTNSAADWKIRKIADLMYDAYHAYEKFTNDGISKEYGDYYAAIKSEGWSAIPIQKLKVGEWHCPLVYEEDEELIWNLVPVEIRYNNYAQGYFTDIKRRVSVARCARVSYLTHNGKRDIEKDLELFERLRTSGHWSPFEHVATPYFFNHNTTVDKLPYYDKFEDRRSGNFRGWQQFRKEFADENCTNFRKEL